MKFPDHCPQSLVADEWWVKDTDEKTVRKGQLRWAVIAHVGAKPYRLTAQGRTDPTNHSAANFNVRNFKVNDRPDDQQLPIAALPNYAGESYSVHRAKVRPVLVIASKFEEIEKRFMKRRLRYQVSPGVLVAPYYSVGSGTSVGFKPEFVERIQRITFRQYLWDCLPMGKSESGSILRLDHLTTIGRDKDWSESTGWCLSEEALTFMDQMVDWAVKDSLCEDLGEVRALLQEDA